MAPERRIWRSRSRRRAEELITLDLFDYLPRAPPPPPFLRARVHVRAQSQRWTPPTVTIPRPCTTLQPRRLVAPRHRTLPTPILLERRTASSRPLHNGTAVSTPLPPVPICNRAHLPSVCDVCRPAPRLDWKRFQVSANNSSNSNNNINNNMSRSYGSRHSKMSGRQTAGARAQSRSVRLSTLPS